MPTCCPCCFNSYSSKDVLCFDNQETLMSQNVSVLLSGSQRINTSSEPEGLKAASQLSMRALHESPVSLEGVLPGWHLVMI